MQYRKYLHDEYELLVVVVVVVVVVVEVVSIRCDATRAYAYAIRYTVVAAYTVRNVSIYYEAKYRDKKRIYS